MSHETRRGLLTLLAKKFGPDIEFNGFASMRVKELRQYGIEPDEIVKLVERLDKVTLDAATRLALPNMSLGAVAEMKEQREQNGKLEAEAKAASDAKKKPAAA